MSTQGKVQLELLISGFVRKHEDKLKLFMIIPVGITQIMHRFYPLLLFKFGDFRSHMFTVCPDRLILKGADVTATNLYCNGHFVYADLGQYDDIGLSQGIHSWSIQRLLKSIDTSNCFCSIGVTTEKNDEIINIFSHNGSKPHAHWMEEKSNSCHSYYEGCRKGWKSNEIITVKLDCNDWNVMFYRDKEEIRRDKIKKGKSYYFAFMCCNQSLWNHFQIVDDPHI